MALHPHSDENRATRWVRKLYHSWVRSRLHDPLARQRLKLVWFVWGYRRLLGLRALSLCDRLRLICLFARIDWNVEHAHSPEEISHVCLAIGDRHAMPGEVVVEAGCWQGGSSAKFSIACRMFGYELRVYDSFAGVEPLTREQIGGGFDFSGTYVAPEHLVRNNIARFGVPEVCSLYPGWFSDTLAGNPLSVPVRVAYIDCDLAKGTREALEAIVPALAPDGVIFSQDYHIEPVTKLLANEVTWEPYGKGLPMMRQLTTRLAKLSFEHTESQGRAIAPQVCDIGVPVESRTPFFLAVFRTPWIRSKLSNQRGRGRSS
jgi:O-methyltransferase